MSPGKRLIVILVVLCGAFFAYSLPYQKWIAEALNSARMAAAREGIDVNWKTSRFTFPNHLTFDVAEFRHGSFPFLPFTLEALSVEPSLLSLFTGQLRIPAHGQCYGGSLAALLNKSLFGDEVDGSLEIQKLRLENYPLIPFWGIAGELSLTASAESSPISASKAGNNSSLTLNLNQFSYVGGHKLHGAILLPPIRDGRLSVASTCQDVLCSLSNLHFESSLGKLEAQGKFSLGENEPIRRAEIEVDLNLSDEGTKAFGGYLALLAQGNVTAPSSHWKLRISKDAGARPTVLASPL